MQGLNLAIAVAAGTVLALTLLSGWIKTHLWGSEALICLLVGVALGPYGFAVAELDIMGDPQHQMLLEQAARLTIALSVMSAALSLPAGYVAAHWRSLLLLLIPGMLLMWAAASLFAAAFLGLGLATALVAGAVVTPTDPVLARSIVSGKLASEKVPQQTRQQITAESGANDGLALPAVLLPIFLFVEGKDLGAWAVEVLLWEVFGAIIIGLLLGKITGAIYNLGEKREFTEQKTLTAITLGLALTTLAVVALAGADGVLAVFVAGLVLGRTMREHHEEKHEHFQDTVDRFFTLPVFILFGLVLPVGEWTALGWPLAAAATALLLLRRLPAWILLQALGRPYPGFRSATFAGWFGPIGVAAIFYVAFALKHEADPVVWPLVSAVIALSVLVHGVTGTPLTKRMRKD